MNDITNITTPPRSKRFEGETVFTERLVMMHGKDYYMRLFTAAVRNLSATTARRKSGYFFAFPPHKTFLQIFT